MRQMRRFRRLFSLFACLLPVCLWAQAAPSMQFELATVKPSRPDDSNSNFNSNPGRINAKNIPLLFLLKLAFNLSTGSDDQIVGVPVWVRTARFDIDTREDDATAKTIAQMPPDLQEQAIHGMVRNLLEDRFHLKSHMEIQVRTVAVLVAAKGGSKLKPFPDCDRAPTEPACQPSEWRGLHNGNGDIEGRGASTTMLANVLATHSDIGGRLVIDDTGLTGRYSFSLHYTPDDAVGQTSGSSLFAALQEQLGLKLETRKIPVNVLVIDGIDHPSPN